ncbi:hypothetical protein CLF_101108 [Clonorchis sinensis]|uniref:Uncharacterized protein n=1 Tax=Clonorchis sinensis TaxID=79923 RepID=G7Y504_CLOSI|nr:hypothetical protein CLF_101108 [Clonorchis sinensis]
MGKSSPGRSGISVPILIPFMVPYKVWERLVSCRIHGDYNCTMNRPNVVNNSVNFFLMQLVIVERKPPNYFVWVRWGRMVSYSSLLLSALG